MLTVVPFDYETVQADLVDRLVQKGYDANVEGSNAALLASVLAHTVSMLNVNTAFNTSEMMLSSATQEANVLQSARQMGYEAQNRVSYVYRITLKAKLNESQAPDSNITNLFEIPKYSHFESGTKKYYYMGQTIRKYISNKNITDDADNAYITINVKEGELKTSDENPEVLVIQTTTILNSDNEIQTQNYIDIPFENVEDDGIELYLTYIDADGIEHIQEPWTKSTQFLIDKDTNLSNQFMRLQDLEFKTPKCYFNLAGIGTELRLNTVIEANVLISSGSDGAATTLNVPLPLSNTFSIYSGVNEDRNQKVVAVGREAEDIESIKLNAPLFHNSANRAVTKYDYVAICNRQSVVAQSQVWGGDEEIPVKLGNIFLSLTPSYMRRNFLVDNLVNNFNIDNKMENNNLFLQDTELRSQDFDAFGNLTSSGVFDVLDDFKIMTMRLNHRHPVFMNYDFEISVVQYNLKSSKQEIHQKMFDSISSYFLSSIEKFETQYFHSNIIKRLDTLSSDLTGILVDLKTSISLYANNINQERENSGEKTITFFLGAPYQDYFDESGVLKPGVLPDIDTTDFIEVGDSLIVDYLSPVPALNTSTSDNFYYNIKYNNVICGRYYVENKIRKHIRIDLYIKDTGAVETLWDNSLLTPAMFSEERTLNLKYKTPDFRTFKNTISRLTSVRFL